MLNKLLLFVCLCGSILFLGSGPAFGLTLTKAEGKLIVENPYYKATILPDSGARIMSLISKETGNEFTWGPGLCEEVGDKYTGNLGRVKYTYKILEHSKDILKIRFTHQGETGKIIDWLMKYQKTFTFSQKSPLIKVELSLNNIGPAKRFAKFRMHNRVVAGEKIDATDTYFLPTTEGIKQIPYKAGNYFIDNFTLGLAGVIDKKSKDTLLFLPEYDSIKQFYFYMGEGKTATNIEWFYRPFTLEKGATWKSSYSILPITLSSLSNLQASLKKYGINLNPSLKVKRAQKPMNILISKMKTGLKKKDIAIFKQIMVSTLIKSTAMTEARVEKNARINNRVYNQSLFTETGAGYEVTLPDAKDIVIEAEAGLKDPDRFEERNNAAFLSCCDPVGNLYSVSEPLTLSFRKKSGLVRLPVSELAGKKIRILLCGPGVNWTNISIVCSEGRKDVFSPISTWTEDISIGRFVKEKEQVPVEVFVKGSIPSAPKLSYKIYNKNNRVIARKKKLSMRKVSDKENLFSIKINTIPNCDVRYTINAGKEGVNNIFKFKGFWRPPLPQRKATYYVAKNGDDSWSGRLKKLNKKRTDGPFASIEKARDTIREIKKEKGLKKPITVMVRKGTYFLRETITFTPEDSGIEKCPITYIPSSAKHLANPYGIRA